MSGVWTHTHPHLLAAIAYLQRLCIQWHVSLLCGSWFWSFFLLERLLVQPRSENGQRRWVLNLGFVSPQGPILVPKWVGGQHNGQLKLDGLFQVTRSHNKLEKRRWPVFESRLRKFD